MLKWKLIFIIKPEVYPWELLRWEFLPENNSFV